MKLFIATLVAFVSVGVFAFPAGYNTSEIYDIKTELDTEEAALAAHKVVVGSTMVVDTSEGLNNSKIIKVQYNSSVDPSTSSATGALSISIPDNAIVLNVTAHVVAAVSSPLEGTPILELTCETNGDLWGSADWSGQATGSISSVNLADFISDGCTPSVSVGAGTIDASTSVGIVNYFIEYLQSE